MSEEQRTEISEVEQNDTEKSVTSGKSNGKKRGIIGGVAVVLIALIIGVSIYNTPSNRLSRQLDLGNRYLEEQNYEQAIIEFDKVIAIDPMSVDAYMGKAQAYGGMGDQEKALETLWTGYEATGDGQIREAVVSCLESYIEQLIAEGRYDEAEALIERYRDKVQEVDFQKYLDEIGEMKAVAELEELQANIPSFDISDIKVMGYDLLEPHFNEIVRALGYSEIPDRGTELQNRIWETVSNDYVVLSEYIGPNEYGGDAWAGAWEYSEHDGESALRVFKVNGQETSASEMGMSRSNMPLTLGDSYEKWCNLLGVDLLRASSLAREEESSSFDEYLNINYTQRDHTISAGDTGIWYTEITYETDIRSGEDDWYYFYDYDMVAIFSMDVEAGNVDRFSITADFLDGTVQNISYNFTWGSH